MHASLTRIHPYYSYKSTLKLTASFEHVFSAVDFPTSFLQPCSKTNGTQCMYVLSASDSSTLAEMERLKRVAEEAQQQLIKAQQALHVAEIRAQQERERADKIHEHNLLATAQSEEQSTVEKLSETLKLEVEEEKSRLEHEKNEANIRFETAENEKRKVQDDKRQIESDRDVAVRETNAAVADKVIAQQQRDEAIKAKEYAENDKLVAEQRYSAAKAQIDYTETLLKAAHDAERAAVEEKMEAQRLRESAESESAALRSELQIVVMKLQQANNDMADVRARIEAEVRLYVLVCAAFHVYFVCIRVHLCRCMHIRMQAQACICMFVFTICMYI
jgi:hypothetical protein